VLSTKSLFAEGIVANLRRNLETQELQAMDAQQPEVIEHLVAYQPSVVILDATDEAATDRCGLDRLLTALPRLNVIRLDPHLGHLQVVTSQQRTIAHISDMVEVINSLA